MDTKLPKMNCQRCGHSWTPRKDHVTVCPSKKCHSAYWDRPKMSK